MAKAFQEMLMQFELTEKILAVNADNAAPNDKMTTKLSQMDNSFEEENRGRCFNHTIQLFAKALLKPFNTALRKVTDNVETEDDDDQPLPVIDEEDNDNKGMEDEDRDDEDKDDEDKDDEDNGIDELEALSEEEREEVLEDTAVVRETVTKVRDNETEDVRLLTCIPIGSTTCICNHQFDDNRSPCLASHLPSTWTQGKACPS